MKFKTIFLDVAETTTDAEFRSLIDLVAKVLGKNYTGASMTLRDWPPYRGFVQVCPVCQGRCSVPLDFYPMGATCSDNGFTPCQTCKQRGVIEQPDPRLVAAFNEVFEACNKKQGVFLFEKLVEIRRKYLGDS
jgi:hypothetical protein